MQTYEEYLETMKAYRFSPSIRKYWQNRQMQLHGHFLPSLIENQMQYRIENKVAGAWIANIYASSLADAIEQAKDYCWRDCRLVLWRLKDNVRVAEISREGEYVPCCYWKIKEVTPTALLVNG